MYTFVDVGAKDGIQECWKNVLNVKKIGFEPNESELNTARGFDIVYPFAVFSFDGKATLYITKNSGCSSLLHPKNDFIESFYPYQAHNFRVQRQIEVEAKRLDSILQTSKNQKFFIKIDAQGAEWHILTGASNKVLPRTIGIELECRTFPFYKKEAPLHSIISYLSDKGFILRELRNISYYEGEQVEFNAFFTLPIKNDENLEHIRFYEQIIGLKEPKLCAFSNNEEAKQKISKEDIEALKKAYGK